MILSCEYLILNFLKNEYLDLVRVQGSLEISVVCKTIIYSGQTEVFLGFFRAAAGMAK